MLKNAFSSMQSEETQNLAPREWVSWLILSLPFLALTLALRSPPWREEYLPASQAVIGYRRLSKREKELDLH